MRTKVQRWGNSLGLRIPKSFAEQTGIETGCEVELSVVEGNLIVRAARRARYDLKELTRGIKKDNLHGEIETGKPVGKESW